MSSLRLAKSLAAIYGAFTLGLYVAIQGPTLMDLIDLLHVNNDIMSYSLSFASLAYSVGGLLSGFLFNYVNRQILISAYFLIFGLSNIVTPFLSSYLVFSVITVFKMICAGGTDCAANVWILELWPGKDAWLQALHFSFAVGCALGPLIVEPFLSVDYQRENGEMDKINGKTSGHAKLDEPANNESRIHIPYGVSGLASVLAALFIFYLYVREQKLNKKNAKLKAKQQAASGEHILLTAVQHPAALEAGCPQPTIPEVEEPSQDSTCFEEVPLDGGAHHHHHLSNKRAEPNALADRAVFVQSPPEEPAEHSTLLEKRPAIVSDAHAPVDTSTSSNNNTGSGAGSPAADSAHQLIPTKPDSPPPRPPQAPPPLPPVKITSKAREEQIEAGRPPYYVMLAIALAAMCLSFYCGIEITSMNYLATFAVNIDLQLPKSTAALMSSALTISFAVGRGFGIFIAAHVKPHKLFYLCAGVMATGNVLMLIFANTAEKLLWYSICLFGIGCGPMFPAIVSFYDDKIAKVTNTVSGIFILGSMFNVALNSLIIGHHIIDNALILIVCNLIGSVLLLLLFGTLHMLTKVKKHQRVKKFRLRQQAGMISASALTNSSATGASELLLNQKPQQQQAQNQPAQNLDQSPETSLKPSAELNAVHLLNTPQAEVTN